MAPQHSGDVLTPLLGALNLQAQRPKYPFVFLPDQMPQIPQMPQLPYMYPNVLPYPTLPYLVNCNEEQKNESFNVPFQMMKTPNGYILQDLESLTQQDPPIPRAVPAMWTNPSELTLAKCLENREGITNVYIRGFLPETSDEILYAYASRFGKIDRCKAIVDLDTGLCKGFETREIAEKVLTEFHNTVGNDGVKLLLRFADTKAQKLLKQQSNERRAYRAGEYNYSVEVVQGSTPSPSLHRLQQTASHLSPGSQVSYPSPVGMASTWTPATSISPPYPVVKNQPSNAHLNTWSAGNSPAILDHTPVYRGRFPVSRMGWMDTISGGSSRTVSSRTALPNSPGVESRSGPTSPRMENVKAESLSPIPSRREIMSKSPRSVH
ncbi:hypothetical protein BDV23DRAFT_191795 [Aspergillus alliaceus]|uniref:Uncharacterized protein n=1 Tax=Petromyces alliaceus TaxID=209559 RepID=A0A5N6FR28_PETAA|nr:uncharacterized protein BDW43DRAFT_320132 [Aspergillus alliaceus]KAB8232442.1 hypothetical protein BDW43DRAFT_320132 [Aspergillus alliaceus]KAE8393374.1 hypothetical protein BDV23DRAFT_191795 [Aspergillus alliaceus]